MDNRTSIHVAGRRYTAEVLSCGWPFKIKFTSDSKLQEVDFEAVGCASATPGEVAEFSACGWSRTSMPGGWYSYTLELISPEYMQELSVNHTWPARLPFGR